MGVWIETRSQLLGTVGNTVTPCMGVWIETVVPDPQHCALSVTPCMGVWIETYHYHQNN